MSRNFALTARRDEYIGGVVIYWQASKHCNNSFCYRLCRHWCRSSHFKKLHVGIFLGLYQVPIGREHIICPLPKG